jgi:UDP:flavonoid glycosyltransferase YjiC (YdhE family)
MRVARIGAGEILPHSRLSPDGLRTEIQQITSVAAYSVKARAMAASIRTAGGVVRAVDVIENAQVRTEVSGLR